MHLDRLAYPRLAHYLDGLPHQLTAHPEAVTKADFSLLLRPKLASWLTPTALPVTLCAALTAPWRQGDWIPTTTYVALCALARDQLWTSDAGYHRGMFDVATDMYKGPLYRTLFFMFGPSLVAMSSAKRWYTLHQGTELIMKKQQKESVHLQLNYPSKLFSETALQSLGAAFCAIAEGSRASDSSASVLSIGDTSAEIFVRWKY